MLTDKGRKIADEAKSEGMWLYNPSYKKWYSPKDFKHIFHYADASDEFLEKLQLRHSAEGIQAGFQRLMEIHNKLKHLPTNVDLVKVEEIGYRKASTYIKPKRKIRSAIRHIYF